MSFEWPQTNVLSTDKTAFTGSLNDGNQKVTQICEVNCPGVWKLCDIEITGSAW